MCTLLNSTYMLLDFFSSLKTINNKCHSETYIDSRNIIK